MSHRTHENNDPSPRRKRLTAEPDATVDDLLDLAEATAFHTAAQTLVPVLRSNIVYVPMLCDLGDTTVGNAADSARTFISKLDLYPGKSEKLFALLDRIQDWCNRQDVTRLADVVDATAEQLIRDVADVADLACEVRSAKTARGASRVPLTQARAEAYRLRQRAHRVRNALVALRAATVFLNQRHRKQRLVDDSLAIGLPTLPNLEDRKGRPLTDEELLLCRFLFQIDQQENEQPRNLLADLLGADGVRPIESTASLTDHLDDRLLPTQLTIPDGPWDFGGRTLQLSPYVSSNIGLVVKRLRPGSQPLTYAGDAPGLGSSTASLGLLLVRRMRRAGIVDSKVTAKSLSLWRVMHTLVTTDDMAATREIHGGRTYNVMQDLKLHFNEDDILDGTVQLLRRDTDQVVAKVPTTSFYDSSITEKGNRTRPSKKRDMPRGCTACQACEHTHATANRPQGIDSPQPPSLVDDWNAWDEWD